MTVTCQSKKANHKYYNIFIFQHVIEIIFYRQVVTITMQNHFSWYKFSYLLNNRWFFKIQKQKTDSWWLIRLKEGFNLIRFACWSGFIQQNSLTISKFLLTNWKYFFILRAKFYEAKRHTLCLWSFDGIRPKNSKSIPSSEIELR